MKILIGYDGSECADAALVDLQRAGLPEIAEATVLSAADVFLPPQDETETISETFPLYVPLGVKLARKRASVFGPVSPRKRFVCGCRARALFG
jgi:hypothetical protein